MLNVIIVCFTVSHLTFPRSCFHSIVEEYLVEGTVWLDYSKKVGVNLEIVGSFLANWTFPFCYWTFAAYIGVDESFEVEGLVVRPTVSGPDGYGDFIGVEMAFKLYFRPLNNTFLRPSIKFPQSELRLFNRKLFHL